MNHKYMLVLGGFIGFSLAFFASYLSGNDIIYSLRNGSVGCVAGAIVMRIFSFTVAAGLKTVLVEKRIQREKEEAEKAAEAERAKEEAKKVKK